MTNFEKVKAFNEIFNVRSNEWPPSKALVELKMQLINEEYEELFWELHELKMDDEDFIEESSALKNPDKAKAAKELADLLYVVYGMADAFGIDADKALDAVHKSNLSKLGVEGKPILRDDGKVLKGLRYVEPDMSFVYE